MASPYSHPDVDRILKSDDAPDGVVFEILSGDKNAWRWTAPLLKDLRRQLLEKFPGLEIAVVSHGGEQFHLTKKEAQRRPEEIETLKGLSAEGVDIQVCGVHSSWRGVEKDEYIDFVEVVVSGPARINDYVNLGYERVLISKPPQK